MTQELVAVELRPRRKFTIEALLNNECHPPMIVMIAAPAPPPPQPLMFLDPYALMIYSQIMQNMAIQQQQQQQRPVTRKRAHPKSGGQLQHVKVRKEESPLKMLERMVPMNVVAPNIYSEGATTA